MNCGILMPISAIPSNTGNGTFGKNAYKFIEYLVLSKQTFWQILPIGQTGFGDSPCQTFGYYSINIYFIDLYLLLDDNLIEESDIIKNDKVDYESISKLMKYWKEADVSRFFICGTTGEMLSLSVAERKEIAEFYVNNKSDKDTICVHVGSPHIDEVIELGKHAFTLDVDSISIVTPMYYKISQRSLLEYFRKVIKAISVDKKIYIYNIPQCSGNDLLPETFGLLLEEFPNIEGLKYSFLDMNKQQEYILSDKSKSKRFLSGVDPMAAALYQIGVTGMVAGTACVYPKIFNNFMEAVARNDKQKVLQTQVVIKEIANVTGNGNMSIFKELLSQKSLCSPFVRTPLVVLDDEEKALLNAKVKQWEEKYSSEISALS